jgi:uncharacterized protein (DUF2062 family)
MSRVKLKNYLKKFLPEYETVKQSRWIRPFGSWLHHPNLWYLHRRSVAGGVAVGMFCGLIPGPLQMVGAAIMSVLFRVNLPVAMFTTLYTNPFTILPLYLVAYKIGAFVAGRQDGATLSHFAIPEMNWSNWYTILPDWLLTLGEPFAIGLLLLASLLAVVGYFAVRVLWYWMVMREWNKRAAQRRITNGHGKLSP